MAIIIHKGNDASGELKGCITLNSIWKHSHGNMYRITGVSFAHDIGGLTNQVILITYHRCDEHGIFRSVRDEFGEIISAQPYTTTMARWIRSFTFYKQLRA